MRAMVLNSSNGFADGADPLELTEIERPQPGPGELLIRISVCGVCHTELDEIEGRTPPRLPVVPGHEIVGYVAETGAGCRRHRIGQRVGVGWIFSSSGDAGENLDHSFVATGRDVNGGYAEYVSVPETYAYAVPDEFSDEQAAPLLCAGAVGFRSLMLSNIRDGEVLGLTGFGASGHLVLQLARHLYPRGKVFVFARSRQERAFARELGADWCGDTDARPPQAPHVIIDTTPAWKPVLAALSCLRPGGRLVINAIRKETTDRHLMADICYEEHLWLEKEIKSVANVTHQDIEAFLPIAARIPLVVETERYALAEANDALRALRQGHVRGAKVLVVAG
ncbi:MAG: alcohol dehydrogenase catalytic domain-containing protein [Woeseiaceae bacterium]|nr:alcohol dehydrogenase catalytic domain-containing protein [Woeseiaceae bacterium]